MDRAWRRQTIQQLDDLTPSTADKKAIKGLDYNNCVH